MIKALFLYFISSEIYIANLFSHEKLSLCKNSSKSNPSVFFSEYDDAKCLIAHELSKTVMRRCRSGGGGGGGGWCFLIT